MNDQYDQRRDPRHGGGGEYAPPQPTMRPAPSCAPINPANGMSAWPPSEQKPYPVGGDDDWARQGATSAPLEIRDPLRVEFLRPYKAHGEDVASITFRKVTPGDLRKIGYPIRNIITPGQGVTALDEVPDVICKYITLLATPVLPPSVVNALEMDDYAKCRDVIMSFFL